MASIGSDASSLIRVTNLSACSFLQTCSCELSTDSIIVLIVDNISSIIDKIVFSCKNIFSSLIKICIIYSLHGIYLSISSYVIFKMLICYEKEKLLNNRKSKKIFYVYKKRKKKYVNE